MKARRLFLLTLLMLPLGGCEKLMHNMYDQPKYETFEAAAQFDDGSSARPPVAGTVALEDQPAPPQPPYSPALLQRGRERFDIYCAPCHSRLGDGQGMVPARGFPNPPSFHIDRLRSVGDRHIYDVIEHGYGVMYPYGSRVPPADRWAIIAWIRALQLSQHASLDQLSAADRKALEALP